jgi:hypothetical protein
MGESLTEQCRVRDEGLRVVNLCRRGKKRRAGNGCAWMVPEEEATANYVPAAAVIRKWRALSGITGRKGQVGGRESLR